MEQTDLAEFQRLCKVETQKLIIERVGGQIQEADLISNFQPNVRIVNLLACKARGLQQAIDIESRGDGSRVGKPRQSAVGAGKRAETLALRTAHDGLSLSPWRWLPADRLPARRIADPYRTPKAGARRGAIVV
jgi:hypothetical protein